LPLPGHLEGISLKPLLENPRQSWKKAAISQYPRMHQGRGLMGYALRTEHHRFVVWTNRGDPSIIEAIELYDHRRDPQENVNVAKDPAYAGMVGELTRLWRAGWRAALPAPACGGASKHTFNTPL
jgi:iduronate 2-sulfatase